MTFEGAPLFDSKLWFQFDHTQSELSVEGLCGRSGINSPSHRGARDNQWALEGRMAPKQRERERERERERVRERVTEMQHRTRDTKIAKQIKTYRISEVLK